MLNQLDENINVILSYLLYMSFWSNGISCHTKIIIPRILCSFTCYSFANKICQLYDIVFSFSLHDMSKSKITDILQAYFLTCGQYFITSVLIFTLSSCWALIINTFFLLHPCKNSVFVAADHVRDSNKKLGLVIFYFSYEKVLWNGIVPSWLGMLACWSDYCSQH